MGTVVNNENTQVTVVQDAKDLARQAAELFVERAQHAIGTLGMFRVALAGGNTPRGLYQVLASADFRDQVDWSLVQVFFSDERFVPLDSPESNYLTAQDALLSQVPIPERFVHPYATTDIAPDLAASNYEEGIRRIFAIGLDEAPRFDLILLGLGPDGHTASLFPGTDALEVVDRLVVSNFVQKLDAWRLTFTYPLINGARAVTFLVQGEDKAEMVGQILGGGSELPAARVRPIDGDLIWLLDERAAARRGPSSEHG